jgi:hypothetical protein
MDATRINPYDQGVGTPYPDIAKQLVLDYHIAHQTDLFGWVEDQLKIDDVYVVWFCKTLQNWKALVSTTAQDSTYYEVTYDGDKKQTYVDKYVKQDNLVVPD